MIVNSAANPDSPNDSEEHAKQKHSQKCVDHFSLNLKTHEPILKHLLIAIRWLKING